MWGHFKNPPPFSYRPHIHQSSNCEMSKDVGQHVHSWNWPRRSSSLDLDNSRPLHSLSCSMDSMLQLLSHFAGVIMGRLRVPYQPHPTPRLGSDADWKILAQDLRGIFISKWHFRLQCTNCLAMRFQNLDVCLQDVNVFDRACAWSVTV